MNPDVAAVDQALDRLRGPTTLDDRLGVLRELVHFWHGPIGPEDGMSDEKLAGLDLPRPLRWWFRWAGKRSEIMSGQNLLLSPWDEETQQCELAIEDGRLCFYVENQAVYLWGTLPDGDDPPVFGRYSNANPFKGTVNTLPWEPETITLSEHLILACLFEAILCHGRYRAATAYLEEQKLNEIARIITPIAIDVWRWGSTRFFARGGAFMCAGLNGEPGDKMYSVLIAAKTKEPLRFLKSRLKDWDDVEF